MSSYCGTCRVSFEQTESPPYGVIHRTDGSGEHLHAITRKLLQPIRRNNPGEGE